MFFMKNPTISVGGQLSNFVLHLDEFSQKYSFKLLNKDNNRYEIWHNDAVFQILILSRDKDHLGNEELEVQTVGSIDIFETLCTFLEWKRYRIDFESHIDKITLPISRITRPYIESQLTNQEADNQESDVIQQRLTRRGLPELPPTESVEPGQAEVLDDSTPNGTKISDLSPRDRRLYDLWFGGKHTRQQAAQELGIGDSTVGKISRQLGIDWGGASI